MLNQRSANPAPIRDEVGSGRQPSRRTPLRRRRLSFGSALGLSLALLVVGWSGLWLFARYEAGTQFEAWLDGERAQGRIWTCPDRRIGGYPLSVALSCANPTFKGAVADGVVEGTMAGMAAEAHLYLPTRVAVTLTAPMTLHDVGTGQDFRVAWTDATLGLRGDMPGALDRGALDMQNVTITPGRDAASKPLAQIARLEAGFRPQTRPGEQRADLDANIAVTDARIPEADGVFGSTEPISGTLQGFATQLTFDGSTTAAAVLDPWWRAGGQLHLRGFSLSKGSFRAEGDGRIALDDEHRVEGRLNTRFSGLDPVAKRFGIPIGAVKIGGMLAGLLGGKANPPDAAADVALPIIAKNGFLLVGPVKTGVRLTPLY